MATNTVKVTDELQIDMECASMEEALTVAEVFTEAGYEVTRPLEVTGVYCIRAEYAH